MPATHITSCFKRSEPAPSAGQARAKRAPLRGSRPLTSQGRPRKNPRKRAPLVRSLPSQTSTRRWFLSTAHEMTRVASAIRLAGDEMKRNMKMAGSLNRVQLIGNLGQDPEIRAKQSGDKIATFSMATTDSWTDARSGEKKEKTEWHRVVIFSDGLAGVAEKYLKKGMKVFIEGALQTRKWTDNGGVEKYTTEVVLQAYNGKLIMLGEPNGQRSNRTHADAPPAGAPDADDEIPF
jgi:single-strand DNA-binding protein